MTLHTTSDVDDYRFTPIKGATFKVTVTPTQGGGTLNVVVLDDSQAVVASGQAASGAVTLTASLGSGRAYTVKVWSSTGGLVMYNLGVGKSGRGGGALLGDGEEGDGTELLPPWALTGRGPSVASAFAEHYLPAAGDTRALPEVAAAKAKEETSLVAAWNNGKPHARREGFGVAVDEAESPSEF